MQNRKILISGLGVAGPTLAFWLKKYGFEPVIIERAPAPRTGGYMIDFWGAGYDVSEKMGILPALKKVSYDIDSLKFVDERDRIVGGLTVESVRNMVQNRFLSLLRSDLAMVLYDQIKNDVECMFDDHITALNADETGVNVTFDKAMPRRFDLVIGADGFHSGVRKLVFGSDPEFERHFGYYAACYAIHRNLPDHFPGAYVMFTVPCKQAARYRLRNGTTVAFFMFTHPKIKDAASRETAFFKNLLRDTFKNVGWECPVFLEELDQSPDFYFDSVSQIQLDRWSKGRIGLVGDAAFCPSLISGQGSALAMAGAYTLAGELKAAGGDHEAAFAAYQENFQPLVDRKQKSAETFAESLLPTSGFRLWKRNIGSRLTSIPFIANTIARKYLLDNYSLRDY